MINTRKHTLRKDIALLKKQYSQDVLTLKSEEVFSVLELTGVFQQAKNIFIYNSLKDEVFTLSFINKWKHEKKFYLPVVVGDEMVFRPYDDNISFNVSKLGVYEPTGNDFTNLNEVDLIIVPGVAFDRKMNRMGRGKGFYDRFLPKLNAHKVGICFDFQLLDSIPCEENDIKMDMIVSENELIW